MVNLCPKVKKGPKISHSKNNGFSLFDQNPKTLIENIITPFRDLILTKIEFQNNHQIIFRIKNNFINWDFYINIITMSSIPKITYFTVHQVTEKNENDLEPVFIYTIQDSFSATMVVIASLIDRDITFLEESKKNQMEEIVNQIYGH